MWLHYGIIFYVLSTGIIFGRTTQKRMKRNTYFILTFGMFTFLSALRSSHVGNDTSAYIRIFNDITMTGDISRYSWRYEFGYLYLNKLLSILSSNSQIIIIVTSILIMLGFARFIYKYSNNLWLSVYLFFTLGYFGMSMNTIRLNIAIVILLFSYDFIKKKNLFKFIITVFIASMFHRTAIIFLIAWLIVKFKFTYKTISVAIVGSVGIYLLFPRILQTILQFFPTYKYYLGSSYLDGNTRLASVMNFLVGLSILIFGGFTNYHNKNICTCSKLNSKNGAIVNDNKNMLLFLLVGVSITFISLNFSLLDRVGEYFSVFSIVFLPNALKSIRDKNIRALLSFIIIVLFFVYSTTIQIMRPEWNVIYPYQFFWQIGS
ncbi:MAG: EpsG family protein [Epulopiscium sp.]|nr:EpsG family protein [Candidatus Epulonipiscium sp.]